MAIISVDIFVPDMKLKDFPILNVSAFLQRAPGPKTPSRSQRNESLQEEFQATD